MSEDSSKVEWRTIVVLAAVSALGGALLSLLLP